MSLAKAGSTGYDGAMATVRQQDTDFEDRSLILVSDEKFDAFRKELSSENKPNEKLRGLFHKQHSVRLPPSR